MEPKLIDMGEQAEGADEDLLDILGIATFDLSLAFVRLT